MHGPQEHYNAGPTEGLTPLAARCPANAGDDAHLPTLREWIDTHLSAPNPDLGRSGPVCPFTRAASERSLLWVTTIHGTDPDPAGVEDQLHELTDVFRGLDPREGSSALLKAILVTFPDLTGYELIDALQSRLKDDFVMAGLMIGQFYPGCDAPGMWNPAFRPLDCPVPLIAIRQMVSSDFVFLNTRTDWIEAYLRRFAPELPPAARSSLAHGHGAASGGHPDAS